MKPEGASEPSSESHLKEKRGNEVKVLNRNFSNSHSAYTIDLSWRQQLTLRLFGRVMLRRAWKPGWREALPFYLVKCKDHGYFEDYPHGHKGYFSCPVCSLAERST